MIYLSQFKDNLLAFVRLMSKTNMLYVDVVHKGRLYRFHMEDLNQEVVKRRRPRNVSLVNQIKANRCPDCRKLMINNICMNSLCVGAKKS